MPVAVEARHPPVRSAGARQRREPHFPEPWMLALWRALVTARPALFDPVRPAPLALGVDRELYDAARGKLGRKRVRRFLAVWTGRTPYLRALARPGSVRRSLRGSVESVTPEHREHARQRLEERRRLKGDARPRGKPAAGASGRR